MAEQVQKLSFIEKAGYSLGDGAANFVFMTMILFQSGFYTDTMGVAVGAAGWLLLAGRLWDAFFDPLMGTIADRTNTRWGKFRPWVLWTALPWGVVMVLAYTTPGFTGLPLLVYAGVTNVLLMTLYSANNTPYSAMTAAMTGDVNERTTLSSYRFFAAMVAQLIVGGFTLPLVAKFGQGNKQVGWQWTMGLWAVVCVVCFVVTFLTTKERIQPPPEQKASLKEDFGNLVRMSPWVTMFVLTVVHFIFVAMQGGTMYYFFQYYLDKNAMFDFLQGFGLTRAAIGDTGGIGQYLLDVFGLVVNADKSNVQSVGFSLFQMFSKFVTIFGVVASTFLVVKFGKKMVAIVCFFLTTFFLAAFILIPADGIKMTFALEFLRALSYAPTIPLLWAIFADVVDFVEWKTGRRTTGVIYATFLFALKAGLSLGGAIGLWILGSYGYEANAAQTESSLLGIRMTISVYPAICLAVVFFCLLFYKIGKELNLQIQDELAERRKGFAEQPAEG
ncbi:MAG: MFS transporter [Acidobacteria bacterium]|nr:MFS transporter [Acidobacteriota bacterium]